MFLIYSNIYRTLGNLHATTFSRIGKVEYSRLYFHEPQDQSVGTVRITSCIIYNSQINFHKFKIIHEICENIVT